MVSKTTIQKSKSNNTIRTVNRQTGGCSKKAVVKSKSQCGHMKGASCKCKKTVSCQGEKKYRGPLNIIVVCNLAPWITEAEVKQLFDKFGLITDTATLYICCNCSLCCVFLVFAREIDAIRAKLEWDGTPLDGRAMKIKFSTPETVALAKRRQQFNFTCIDEHGNKMELDPFATIIIASVAFMATSEVYGNDTYAEEVCLDPFTVVVVTSVAGSMVKFKDPADDCCLCPNLVVVASSVAGSMLKFKDPVDDCCLCPNMVVVASSVAGCMLKVLSRKAC